MLVRQILSAKPDQKILTIAPDASIGQATEKLSAHRIGALVVSKDGDTVDGIISERDIVRELGQEGPDALLKAVSELMTKTVVGCSPADTAVSVLERMTQGRFRHMPVAEDGHLTGFISIGDVVKARIDEVEHENSALTEMIAGNV